MSDRFQSQTNVATFDIGLNIFSKTWQIIFPDNKLFSFINTKMIYQKVVIIAANKLCLNNFRHKQQLLIIQYQIDICPTFLQLFYGFEFFGFFIQLLQLCQPQLHSINTSYIKIFIGQFDLKHIPKLMQLGEHVNIADENLVER